eukprot:UN15762
MLIQKKLPYSFKACLFKFRQLRSPHEADRPLFLLN